MKKAVMYGAGNIGRGFIGKVLSEAGFEVAFIDVIPAVVEQLNRDREYPVRLVSSEETKEVMVKNVRAVSGMDGAAVTQEIAGADIMATAVGVHILPRIAANIAAGLDLRAAAGAAPLDIIICENLLDADKYLRGLLEKAVKSETRDYLDKKTGLIEASIGRMVPVMTDEMREGNALRVWVEPYEELPVDADGFRGLIPPIKTLVPFSPFGFYIRRKLFIHNMGHALCAYFGWLKGYTYIYEAAEDEEIASRAEGAMRNVAAALHREYGIPLGQIEDNVFDLLRRFGNRALMDSVARVGKDPVRKLKSNDRLTGAALYCMEQGTSAEGILPGIAAALRFNKPDDPDAMEMQAHIAQNGVKSAIQKYCGIGDAALIARIADEYDKL
jgi:mannitol-1-phosphate 5-dehydrogenase